MKKSVLTILEILGLAVILFIVFMPREKLQKINIPFIKSKNSVENIKLISSTLPSDYNKGYFYVKFNDGYRNIMFFDFDSKKEVYLCNKPNCKHDNDSCSSYLDIRETNDLFYYKDSLYLLNASADGQTISVSFDGIVDDSHDTSSTIYKMNLDGTDKQKVLVAPSGTRIAMPFVMKENILYGYLEKRKVQNSNNNSFKSSVVKKTLVAINIETGKLEELQESLYSSLIGYYNDKLVIQEIEYIKNPNDLEDDSKAYFDNLYNSKVKIKLFDVETQKEKVIYEDIFKSMEQMQFYKNGIYFIGEKSKSLEFLDFSTGKKEVIVELPQVGMQLGTIIDDKILVYSYKDKDAHLGDSYYIDLFNKDINKFTLKDKNGYLVDILSSNEDYYFVQLDTVFGDDYTTWAGTSQKEIIGVNYGLIKKVDYWTSKANYIKMSNAK